MSAASLSSRAPALYNPSLFTPHELRALSVCHQSVLSTLLDDLRRETGPHIAKHHLIMGRAGMGKTTLLRQLEIAIADDAKLSHRWISVRFPELHGDLTRLSDFTWHALEALCDSLVLSGDDASAHDLRQQNATHPAEEPARRKSALSLLLQAAKRLRRSLILLVDNLEEILGRFDEHDTWALRETLMQQSQFLVIGTSAGFTTQTTEYQQPFYDFFQLHELRAPNTKEAEQILRVLARPQRAREVGQLLRERPSLVPTWHALGGGFPRGLALLFDVLMWGGEGDLRVIVERALDRTSPIGQAQMGSLSVQAKHVLHVLAIHGDPLSAAELASQARLDRNVVSSQLSRLVQQGLLEKVPYHPASKTGYQVADRLFQAWVSMRAGPVTRSRLGWLIRYMELTWETDRGNGDSGLKATARAGGGAQKDDGAEREAKRVLLRKRSTADARFQAACALVETGHWSEARVEIERCLRDQPLSWLEHRFDQWVRLFVRAVASGHVSSALQLVDDSVLATRWRPLREALAAASSNSDATLRRVAPEVRTLAAPLLKKMQAER